MARITIKVAAIEFDEGGHTMWVQSKEGTVLRIKCTGKITTNTECENTCSHSDMIVQGDINVCLKT